MSARSTVSKFLSVVSVLAATLIISGCGGSTEQPASAPQASEATPTHELSFEEKVQEARSRYEAALEAEAATAMAPDAKLANIVTYYCKAVEPLLGDGTRQAERSALMQVTPAVYKKYWKVVPGVAQKMPYEFTMVATEYGCFFNPQ